MNEEISYPVSMIMIAYNEAGHIERVLREYCHEIFDRLPKGSEFVIYLDKPTDSTPKIVKSLQKKLGFRLVEGKINLGYALALTAALKKAKNSIVFYSDSSGKHRASDFWRLIKHIPRFDIVNGLRSPRYDPLVRRFVTFCQRLLISFVFFLPFYDFNTGFKIVKKSVLDSVLDECKYMKQSFSSEFLIRACRKGFSIVDVPVVFKDRVGKNTGTKFVNLPPIILRSLLGFVKLRFEKF